MTSNIQTLYGNTTSRSGLAESPVWDDVARCWYWIDIPKRQVHRHTESNLHTEWQLPQDDANDPGAMCIAQDGQLILALRSGVAQFSPSEPEGNIYPKLFIEAPYDKSNMRANDGGVDAQGRFWFGTLYSPKTHAGASLYCLEKGVLHAILGDMATHSPQKNWGVTTSNGWAMSLDGQQMFQADTQAHAIYQFDFDNSLPVTEALSNRRIFFETLNQQASLEAHVEYQGRPDGSAIDSAGNYWNAQFDGGQIIQFSPKGEILQRIDIPARCPTMVCFGGNDLKTLLITTTGKRPDEELASYPANGFILTMQVEVAGLPTRRYINQ